MQARAIHPRFERFVSDIASKVNGAEFRIGTIKKMARVVEKAVYTKSDRADYSSVKDLVRAAIVCRSMAGIRRILELVVSSDDVSIVRIKNRFANPTTGGWADISMNLVFDKHDVTSHVVELQIAHKMFWLVREDFNEHDAYGAFRQAYEILRVFGVECSAKELVGPLGEQLALCGITLAASKAASDFEDAARAKSELERLNKVQNTIHDIESQIADALSKKDYNILHDLQSRLNDTIADNISPALPVSFRLHPRRYMGKATRSPRRMKEKLRRQRHYRFLPQSSRPMKPSSLTMRHLTALAEPHLVLIRTSFSAIMTLLVAKRLGKSSTLVLRSFLRVAQRSLCAESITSRFVCG